MRSRAGSVNTVSSLRTGTQAGSIRRFGDASPPEMPSKTPSHSRSRSGATASHAGGIQPPAAFFRTAPSTPSKSSPHRNMPFRPTKHSRTPTRSAIPVPRRGATHDSRHGTDASDLEFTSRSSGEHDRAPFVPIGLLSATHSDSPATAEQTTAHVFNDSSFSTSQAADASFGTTGPGPLSYRSKPSRDPLLPTLNDQPVPVRGTKPRGSIDQVFQRQSLETNRSSFDVEKGAGSPIPMTELVKEGPSNRSDGPIPVVPHSPAGTSGPDTHRRSYVGPRRAMSPNSPPHAASGFSHSSISRPAHMSQPSSRHLFYPRSITPHGHPPEAKMPTRPVLDSKTGRPVRNYSRHPGANVFCFNGRMLTGGDSPLPFIGTLIFVFGLAGVWFGCVAPWWWHHVSPAVPVIAGYLTLVSISSLVITATKDPGILPRNLDPDPPYTTSSQVSENTPAVPMPRDIQVRAGIARVKWCQTCRMYRPPRSSHCKMCDNCVDGCDHHCQWVNNCVGRRNYTHFFTLIIAMSVTDIYIVVTSALQLYFLSKWDHLRFRRCYRTHPELP
ncbi:DHHC palmitoyltransferase-domain-containing protein [Cantharellus anzutake]|uniref:DHHC palmitoyltransferase-domain-containing protein n=1 Tax=Cantharellus anzutake TaxID=1750568 RepID=UPI00190384F4|nr:DHHC palmitoyltransferase-domain-containing protein [Cantharellus anzutake]KAF8334241.1 DHHC palmitoyltransferase-domain-containing protein [Cantharellus anzutake]